MARRRRLISSSLLPENMGPQITSIHPTLPVMISIWRNVLPAIPVQADAVAPVGSFQFDAGDVLPIVHRQEHGTAQAPILGSHVGFEPPFIARYHGAGKKHGTAAIGAEGHLNTAAAIDIDVDAHEAAHIGIVIDRRSATLSVEVQNVIPDEASAGAALVAVAAGIGRGAHLAGGDDVPGKAEVIAAEAAVAITDENHGCEIVAPV